MAVYPHTIKQQLDWINWRSNNREARGIYLFCPAG